MGAGHSNSIHEDEPALASLQDIDIFSDEDVFDEGIFSDEHISEQHGGKKVLTIQPVKKRTVSDEDIFADLSSDDDFTKEESDALTNIIQLVRFAFHQIERLDSVVTTSKQFFNLWLGQNQREITDKQREVISRIVDYIASNGACTIRDIREDDATHAAQMIRAFGNMQKADEALHSLYTFVVLRKAA